MSSTTALIAIASYGSAESRSYSHRAGRDRRRDEQQDDEDVLELREELPPRRHRRLGGQLVSAVALEPDARFGRGQAASRVGAEGGEHFLDGLLIRERLGAYRTSSFLAGRRRQAWSPRQWYWVSSRRRAAIPARALAAWCVK